ncbi:RHS repeat-associated core domain-containing protein [Burkholderia ubonensis]|uniref:RHS repeat-associated core domain-containing protein n=1 Tax=Burkholderia ubonensis TaxID=101571 RepID=UPI000ACA6442|nr:RHS repeat-associated core domain-containing protein [Burkholderia ubonensis]
MSQPAARKDDPITHTTLMGDLIGMGGSLLGGMGIGWLLSTAAEALVFGALGALEISTGGLATPIVLAIGVGVAAYMQGSGLNDEIDQAAKGLGNAISPPEEKGKISSGSPNVFVNGEHAARAADGTDMDTVQCSDHSGPQMIAQGSDCVFINDLPAARVNDKTTCDGTISKGSPDVFFGGGTKTVRDIKAARGWVAGLGAAIGIALALCGRGKMNWSGIKSKLPCLALNLGASLLGTAIGSLFQPSAGHPVNLITGGKILDGTDDIDFALPGPLPIVWRRFYSSHDDRSNGLFGPGWSVPISVELQLARENGQVTSITYWDEQGREIVFPAVPAGESHFSVPEGIYLICTAGGHYVVETVDGLYRDFGQAHSTDADAETLKLWRLEDRNGNWIEVESEIAADVTRPARIRDNVGRVLTLSYADTSPQRIAAVDLTRGVDGEQPETLVRYAYTDAGELASVTDRSGYTGRRFAYENGLMTQHTLPGGLQCFYAWQGVGRDARVVRHWTDDGEAYTFDADLAQQAVTITDQTGRVTRWTWNEDQQPTSHTDAEGHVWQLEWNGMRLLVATTDPAGHTTRFEYDELGRRTARIDALGHTELTEWNGFYDLPVAQTDPANARWIYRYDTRGNLTMTRDPAGFATEYHRDERGLVHTIRDARAGYKRLEWNARAQLTAYTDCSGKTTRFAYDARGSLSRVTDAAGQDTVYEADALGRVTSITTADGARQTFRYDDAGRLVEVVDPSQRSTRYAVNPRGLLLSRTDAAGRIVSFGYDNAFRLAALTNENRETYRFHYDRRDLLAEEIGLDGSRRTYAYDACGQGVAVREGTLETRYERNAIGQLSAKESARERCEYLYDPAGRIASAELYTLAARGPSLKNRVNLKYGARGEVLEEYTPTGWLAHTYDELGNRTSTTISGERTIDWLHYGSGHVHQVRVDDMVLADIERDDLHREVLRTQGKLTSRFGYDRVGRRAQQTAQRGASPEALLGKRWQYDAAGDVIAKRDQRYGTTAYSYDPTGRIEQAAGPGLPAEVFRWDAAANLVSSDHSGGYVEHNRLRMFEDKRFEYDAYGRLSRKLSGHGPSKEQTFEYDDWHQLKTVVTKDRIGVSTTHFEYDAFGRRIRKLNGSYSSTDFLWDGMRLVQETYHDRRGAEALTYLYEANSYVPLARIDHAAPAANDADARDAVYYFHNDVSGLPEELTDVDGELVWQARYKVWGNAVQEEWIARTPQQPSAAWGEGHAAATPSHVPRPQNLRFQGQYLDRETGLHYNTFRFYDPDIGRFINPDPIGLLGGLNLYRYASNPLAWIDPWGWACGELSGKAQEVHNLAGGGDARSIRNSTVSIVEAKVNGKTQLFAAGSGGRLSPAQRQALVRLGVPEENIFHGKSAIDGFDRLENHAERIILRNLPEGAEVTRWGVSWGGLQRNASCASCQPHVEQAGGIFD